MRARIDQGLSASLAAAAVLADEQSGPGPVSRGPDEIRAAMLRASGPWADMNCAISGRSAAAEGLKAGMRPWVGLMVATPLQ